jgi:allantoicase
MIGEAERMAVFAGLVDLAAERVGGKTLAASDEFFAEKENLLKPGRGIFVPDRYTDRGKWMDGWETRRKRIAPEERARAYDWCIIKLGLPGIIRGIDIDTNHFLGNSPAYASVEACTSLHESDAELQRERWVQLVPKSPIQPGAQNLFAVADGSRWTHVRLTIYPDGGVARLRVYGIVVPDWTELSKADRLDLAALANGGMVVAASDMFFGNKENLIMPYPAASMADGWETRRRRGPGHDWAIVRLARPGCITAIEVDTAYFKGNAPDRCSIDCCDVPDGEVDALNASTLPWHEILPPTKLQPDTRHLFERELKSVTRCTHVRLNIYPDGGVSRLRVWGKPL